MYRAKDLLSESLVSKGVWVYECQTGSLWSERSPAGKGKSELLTQLVPARGNWNSGYHVLQAFTFPWETGPYPEGQENTHSHRRSLSTSLTWQTDLCASLSKFSGPVREGEIEGKNMRAGEIKIKRERGREVTVMKEELLFMSTLLSPTFRCEDPHCHFY